mgnify:CR=1 FL=1
MIAIIRISAKDSKTGNSGFFPDKFSQVKACNESLIRAGECERLYLLDNCPPEWLTYFEQFGRAFPGVWGKKESLWEAYRVASTQNQNILFLEDDYLWRPGTLDQLDLAIEHFGCASPYDHPDQYSDDKEVAEVYRFNNQLWRHCLTNTHTFGVRHEIFNEHLDAFYYGLHDWQMWFKLKTEGVKLYTPLNSFATHLATGHLAVGVDWEAVKGEL